MSEYCPEYLRKWISSNSLKVANNEEFIKHFISYMSVRDRTYFDFTGENNYCGNTAVVFDQDPIWSRNNVAFEFAYGKDFVKVFNANNNGFWVPELINLRGEDAQPILAILKEKLLEWSGF
jgi:hypothetical protein